MLSRKIISMVCCVFCTCCLVLTCVSATDTPTDLNNNVYDINDNNTNITNISEDNNTDVNMYNSFYMDENDTSFSNMTNPFSQSNGTPAIPDENNCFEMTTNINAGTGYYWVVDTEASYGVNLINIYTVDKNPIGLCGGRITNHFVFHISDNNNYFVKLNLIDARNGEIVDTINSEMVN